MENYSTSKHLKDSPEKSHILSCDTVVANERYIGTKSRSSTVGEARMMGLLFTAYRIKIFLPCLSI
jgi:hypothetical protein